MVCFRVNFVSIVSVSTHAGAGDACVLCTHDHKLLLAHIMKEDDIWRLEYCLLAQSAPRCGAFSNLEEDTGEQT